MKITFSYDRSEFYGLENSPDISELSVTLGRDHPINDFFVAFTNMLLAKGFSLPSIREGLSFALSSVEDHLDCCNNYCKDSVKEEESNDNRN